MKKQLLSLKRLSQVLFSLTLFLLCANVGWSQTTVFDEGFGTTAITGTSSSAGSLPSPAYVGSTSAVPGSPSQAVYGLAVSPGTTYGGIASNIALNGTDGYLFMPRIGSVSGKTYVHTTMPSGLNSQLKSNTGKITWTINLRTSNTGAGGGSYADNNRWGGFILCSSTSDVFNAVNANAGTGYAVMMNRSSTVSTVHTLKLVKLTQGLNTSASFTNTPALIQSVTLPGITNYYSVMVTYDPANDTFELLYRNDGTSTWADPTSGGAYTSAGTIVETTYTSTTMTRHGYVSSNTANSGYQYDNYKITLASSTPTITAPSPSSLTGLDYFTGAGPSAAKTFTVGGSSLTNDIVLTPTNTDFELSAVPGGAGAYSNTLTLSPTTGTVASTTIYARLKAGLANASYSTTVNITSTGATSRTVTLSGAVTAPSPVITSSTAPTAFSYEGAGPSVAQTTTITGVYLTGPITINTTLLSNYEVSIDNFATTGSGTAFQVAAGNTAGVTLSIRLKAGLSAGTKTDNITLQSSGASDVVIACTGTVTTPYVYNGVGALNVATNWTPTADFSATNAKFIITGTAETVGGLWTLGTGSKLYVGNAGMPGATLTITNGNAIAGTIDMPAASTGSNKLYVQSISTGVIALLPTFGTLDVTSEVHFDTPIDVTFPSSPNQPIFGKLYADAPTGSPASDLTFRGNPIIKAGGSLVVKEGAALFISGASANYITFESTATAVVNGEIRVQKTAGYVDENVTTPGSGLASLQFKAATKSITYGANSLINYDKWNTSSGNTGTVYKISGDNYVNVAISDNADFKVLKSLVGNVNVSGTLTLNNVHADSEIQDSGSFNFVLGNGAKIVRTSGSFGTAAGFSFGTAVDVTYDGTTAITSGAEIPTATSVLNNLTINNAAGVTLASATSVNNKLTLTSGELATAGMLTLKSNATKTAVVAPVTGTISGNVIAERFIPAGHRAYRLLSSPTTGGTLHSNWQENQANGDNNNAGFGTHLTGALGATNGFDTTTTNAASIYTYGSGWTALPNTSGTLTAADPYLVYVRGSRQATNITGTSNDATTLRTTGTLTTGSHLVMASNAANGFTAVGNPYQAQVDMEKVLNSNATALNLTKFYYFIDPAIGAKGAYVTVDVTSPGAYQYLQPGQAIFVNTVMNGVASLQFDESDKSDASAQTAVFKTKTAATPSIDLTLYNGAAKKLDVLKVSFSGSESNAVNQNDALKLTNFDENMATANSGKLLAIEKRANPVTTDEIPLSFTQYKGTSYSLKIQGSGLTETPYLYDAFTAETTEIPVDGTIDYAYTVDATNASSAADRFKLIYAKTLKTIDNAVAGFSLYPNPSKSNSFNIVVPQSASKASLSVSNLLGQNLYSKKELQSGATAITVSNVKTAGVYLVTLTLEGKTSTTKWIVE